MADVVKVRVRQDDGVDRIRAYRKFIPVPEPQLFQALEQSAVEEHAASPVFKQVFGAGDRARRAQECQFRHAATISDRRHPIC